MLFWRCVSSWLAVAGGWLVRARMFVAWIVRGQQEHRAAVSMRRQIAVITSGRSALHWKTSDLCVIKSTFCGNQPRMVAGAVNTLEISNLQR